MSTVLISRLAKLTLQQSRAPRWIATTTPYLFSLSTHNNKKASTAAATPAPAPNNNIPASGSAGSDDPEQSTNTSDQGSSNNAVESNTTGNSTKGRKTTRKSRRSVQVIPKSFFDSNYLRHQSLPKKLDTCYADTIPDYLWQELLFVVEAGFAPKGTLAAYNHSDHIVLNVPSRGATFMQDAMARQLAVDAGADLVIFDAQDFVALAQTGDGHVMTLLPSMSTSDSGTSAVLAIRPHHAVVDSTTTNNNNKVATGGDQPPIYEYDSDQEALMGILEKMSTNNNHNKSSTSSEDEELLIEKGDENKVPDPRTIAPKAMAEMAARYSSAFERMLQTGYKEKGDGTTTTTTSATSQIPKLIYLRDYGDMHDLPCSLMLKSLMMAVEHLKQKGHRLVVLAGYSPSLASTFTNYKQALEEDEIPLMTTMKCISLPPPLDNIPRLNAWETQMKLDSAKRMGEINAKQILAMIQQKNVTGIKHSPQVLALHSQSHQNTLMTGLSELKGIQESIWTGIEIERHATFAIGHALQHKKTTVDLDDIIAANHVIRKSITTRQQLDKTLASQRIRFATTTNITNQQEQQDSSLDMTELKKYCDEYEQRFLSRIVDPYKVQVSFADIRAPSTTIDTLQTLITLPLARPDLFRRGILKKNFIPGVLLFGPPGTGKTMLAKAICKAGGSRMLEVQASDIYEMYLGEGEKNVKALFSLARKLASPSCVIFIDEVDSIMSRRRSDSTSNAHREIINQFMVEWDGLTSDNQGVIVMAATNRPRDLDDAVLRRLPRRILVDLPNEEDRAEILRILLRDEEEHQVSVAELARATEHYSGSDLKNLCVTAALKAAQKEAATQEKQILGQSYFNEALKLVRPSSSEDMDTIKDLRKWASEYGDGGTRSKQQMIGFS
ncbi:hypothetical protein BDA99DRAFT_266192 [Phascolomyces articulosus]|uniref:AAA+ ATPase domain-containing protein n=1 Tax=Phascolomyces articulosus TaxID=60185 RepID=A0AAD5JN93_9FUNG|nr:hypothetical protein BDA99DRAFT_266192 [Phascolomyces articulosus]